MRCRAIIKRNFLWLLLWLFLCHRITLSVSDPSSMRSEKTARKSAALEYACNVFNLWRAPSFHRAFAERQKRCQRLIVPGLNDKTSNWKRHFHALAQNHSLSYKIQKLGNCRCCLFVTAMPVPDITISLKIEPDDVNFIRDEEEARYYSNISGLSRSALKYRGLK